MTVYRVSNKIRPSKQEKDKGNDIDVLKCKLCFGRLDLHDEKPGASARNDLNFTQKLFEGIFGDPGSLVESVKLRSTGSTMLSQSDLRLCYSCSLAMKEVKLNAPEKTEFLSELPSHHSPLHLNTEQQLKDKLNGILIEE